MNGPPAPGSWLARRSTPASRRFVRFVLAAGASVPVNIAARVLFSHWVAYGWAIVLSHLVGMVTAYALTRLFVFERSGRSSVSELSRFALVNVVSVAVTWVVSVTLVKRVFPAVHFVYQTELVAHVSGLAVASITSFIGHSRFSFRKVG